MFWIEKNGHRGYYVLEEECYNRQLSVVTSLSIHNRSRNHMIVQWLFVGKGIFSCMLYMWLELQCGEWASTEQRVTS